MSQTRKQGKDGFSAQFITDWKGLVDLLAFFQDGEWIYRGQSQDRRLATSLERRLDAWGIDLSSGPRVERQLIREFRRRLQGAELDDVMNDTPLNEGTISYYDLGDVGVSIDGRAEVVFWMRRKP
jgi:hypothetical protein